MARSESGEAEKAREYALLLLSYRERTEKELLERLLRKKYPSAVATPVIADLKRLGLVDDERFARLYVQERARLHPRSAGAIGGELARRGISREIAEKALLGEFVPGREEEMAAELVRRAASRLRGVPPEAAKRRLWGYLARRGFSPGQIAAAVQAAGEIDGH